MTSTDIPLPGRLSADEPGWTTTADVVVVGTGIAGLTAALRLRHQVDKVLVVTKDVLSAGSTQWAQGGIAAALGPGDTPGDHQRDTLVAGAGACDPDAVRVLVNEGPEAVRELIALGANFDHSPEGELSLTREGGHHRDRIAHAGGDATGAEIQRALVAAIHAAPDVEVVEHALAVDLLLAADGGVAGITLHVMGEGQRDGVGAVRCRAVVLASGGLGQVFSQTTNPAVSTGDGMALALRAGAVLRDLEFVQFHPTVMYLGPESRGQQPLISEAVRGEGAFLVDFEGVRFMQGQHELADLAPRDVVAKAITRRMHETGHPHMWLDARHLGHTRRSVEILGEAVPDDPRDLPLARGRPGDRADPGRAGVPLRLRRGGHRPLGPFGGARVSTPPARSPAPGCTGPTGSPPTPCWRGWSSRGGSRRCSPRSSGRTPTRPSRSDRPGLVSADIRTELQGVMTERVGVLRSAEGLDAALAALAALAGKDGETGTAAWEATNLLTISTALAEAARLREETRGSHWREDFPDRDDERWSGHVDATLDGGHVSLSFHATAPSDEERT